MANYVFYTVVTTAVFFSLLIKDNHLMYNKKLAFGKLIKLDLPMFSKSKISFPSYAAEKEKESRENNEFTKHKRKKCILFY